MPTTLTQLADAIEATALGTAGGYSMFLRTAQSRSEIRAVGVHLRDTVGEVVDLMDAGPDLYVQLAQIADQILAFADKDTPEDLRYATDICRQYGIPTAYARQLMPLVKPHDAYDECLGETDCICFTSALPCNCHLAIARLNGKEIDTEVGQ